MICTATPKPSLAPSTKVSYTGIRRSAPATRNSTTSPRITPLPIAPTNCEARSAGKPVSHQLSPPTRAPNSATGTQMAGFQIGRRWISATSSSADSSEIEVTTSVGKKMSAALKPLTPCCTAMVWRIAITEVGISVSPAVFSTRNRICALVARSGCGLSDCSSCMALSPSGVAALSSPSMLADMFIVMAPCAGWPAGTPGNRWRNMGSTPRASTLIRPAFSPTRSSPSHNAIMPVRPMAISKPDLAASNSAVSKREKASRSPCSSCHRAIRKPPRKKPSQTRLSTMRPVYAQSGPLPGHQRQPDITAGTSPDGNPDHPDRA